MINRLIYKCKVSWLLCYICSYTVAKISTLNRWLLPVIYFCVPWKALSQEIFLQLYRSFAFPRATGSATNPLMNPIWHLQCLGPPGSPCGIVAKPTPTLQQPNSFQVEKFLQALKGITTGIYWKQKTSALICFSFAPDNIHAKLNSWACACSTAFAHRYKFFQQQSGYYHQR